ncbi:MAG: TonB-dependent receptor [Chryseolinea sp.]
MRLMLTCWFLFCIAGLCHAQERIHGIVTDVSGTALPGASIRMLSDAKVGAISDVNGTFELTVAKAAFAKLSVSFTGYKTQTITVKSPNATLKITLEEQDNQLQEVMVVSGSLKEVTKSESPINIEVYSPTFFLKNPAPSLFESMSNINGVRPQLNCNVCNTGDIHINGLEGPYTMIMIDGMPIVSGLSTVYGLTGIPASLIERVEIVKGPASTLYGSEAVAGLVNVITKQPGYAPIVAVDVMATSWGEVNNDVGVKFNMGEKVQSLLGVNYFFYDHPADKNNDGFTDVTLQRRISVFDKLNFVRDKNRVFTIAGRYNYEDRWGGDVDWTPAFRGGDSIYGESIYTKRWELIGKYQLPVQEDLILSVSANGHHQNSYYGTTAYFADQKIAFGQLTWNKSIGKHEALFGAALRYTYYDDNTAATQLADGVTNQSSETWLPGFFIQDELSINQQNKLLVGVRYDYNSLHGNIFSPRLNYKWSSFSKNDILRVSIGNGYRVANVFTEDHAALTGARTVVFLEDLEPETSWNVNINYVKKIVVGRGFIGIDASAFYTRFNNKIFPDYVTNPNEIIYSNLNGHGVSQGMTLNTDLNFSNGLKILAGVSLLDVNNFETDGQGSTRKSRQLLSERFTGVWSVSYPISKYLSFDYTGNVYGPMLLPLLSDTDPRSPKSPVWSLQNIQLSWEINSHFTLYGGIKNILNYTPPANSIARSFDPFDKEVIFDENKNAVSSEGNPYALTFDPTYVFAPNQGIRGFVGMRFVLE